MSASVPLPGGATWTEIPEPSGGARVTVVIPCHNYGRFLEQCVASVLAQEHVDVDLLIMDDASTDTTPAVASGLAQISGRVRVVRHQTNRGHVPTYNEGLLSLATGDYLVLLSADDMLTRGSLARATAVMESDAQIGLVYGHPKVMFGERIPAARTGGRGVLRWEGERWIEAQCRRGLSIIYSPEVCVRASVQQAVGGYHPALPSTGDLEMWMRIAAVARVARVNCDQAYRRVHHDSMMNTTYRGLYRDMVGRARAYETFFAGSGATLSRARELRWLARHRLAQEALQEACVRLRRGEDPNSLPDYVDFAARMENGELTRARGWVEYRNLLAARDRGGAISRLLLAHSALRRDLDNRYRWCRWRLAGV